MIVLATPSAVRIIGVIPWINNTMVKKAATSCDEDAWKAVQDTKNILKVWFQRQGPHSQRMLGPALVILEADWSTRGRNLRILQPCSSHTLAAGWSMYAGA